MIDLGLTKLALIGAVALVVIGPERLPAVARMAGTLFGRAQRYISSVKAEVNREMQMEELRKMQDNIVSSASDLNKSVADDIAEAEQDFSKAIAADEVADRREERRVGIANGCQAQFKAGVTFWVQLQVSRKGLREVEHNSAVLG